jgi:hypothetical protein
MLDWAAIARSESGPDWMNALGATTKTSRGVFVGPLNIARKTWQIYSNAYKKQTGVDVGNFNNPNATPSWQDQVKIAEMVAFKGIPDSQYEYYRQPKFLDGYEGVRKNKVFFQPFSELKAFDKALGFANGGAVRRPKTGGSAGSIYDFDYRGVIPDRIEDKLRAKGIPSSRRQIPKEQDPNSRRRGRITPIIPPEKRYPQDGSYEPDAPWAGYTNQPDPPWIHHEGGGADRQPQMTTWKDHIGEPVGSFGTPVWYRHILGYYPTDRIPKGGKKGKDVSIEWDGKNRWSRMYGGMIPQFKLGGFLKPGFGLPNLKGFNPLSWLFGKKSKNNNQNQTMFTDKPKFSIKKEPWKTYLKNQLEFYPNKTEQQITEELYAEYLTNLEDNGSQKVTLPVPQYIKNMPLQLAMENDSVNKIGQIARGGVVQTGLTENGLIMRGIKKIFVSPEYWNEKELFRNDGDSIWRKAANKTTKDNVLTSHMSMLELHKGVTAAMDSVSKYLNIPYQFTYSPKQFGVIPTIKDLKKSMVLDVFGDFDPSSGFAGYTYSNIKTPSSPRSNASVKEAIRQASNYSSIFLNTALANEVDNGMPYYGTEEWSQTFMHEFGHVAGGFDHPHEYNQALSRKFDGSSNTNKMLNSIMSYDTNGGKITRQLRPTDINAYKEGMGFSLSPASIIRRLDANKNIFNSQGSVPNEQRRGSGYMLDLINKKKQLPRVKKFEQGGFIGPMLPKKKKNFWGKVAGIGKGAFNIGKEILRPKNSFAIAGGTLAAILATPGGPAAMVAAGMAGSAAGGGIGSFVEQAFDKKKGFQPLDIGKNMLLQGAMYGLGAGAGAIGERFIMPALAKYGTPALRGMGDVAMNKLGLAGMDATAIPGLIKAGVSYTKSKALSLLGKGVGKASPYVDDVLKGALEKQGYLLHHSKNSIKIGDFVRQRLIGSDQVTAGDALPGYSYAWDALTGVNDAVKNQVSGRISRILPNGLPNPSVPEQFQDFFVHLTRAQKSNIYPDLNVPGSPARAITSAQEVIDSIKIPAIISNDEAEMFVRNMLLKNNVPFNLNPTLSREMNKKFLFSKGSEALKDFHKGQFEEYVTRVFRMFDKGAPAWANGVIGKDAKLAHDLYLSGDIEKAKELLYGTFLGTAAGQKVSGLKKLLTIKQLTTGIPRFEKGGYLKFKEGGEVPSILHGGEYVLNAAAVKKYGLAHLEAMNQMKFNVPSAGFSVPQASYSGSAAGGMTTSTQNVNIYVDNFIGEPEWFNSMMKDYNTKILPKNQKAAGLENRVISTYNGLNRGQ